MWHIRGKKSCINWFRWEKETEAPMSKDSVRTDLEEVRLDAWIAIICLRIVKIGGLL
jgi:hypothetical protein